MSGQTERRNILDDSTDPLLCSCWISSDKTTVPWRGCRCVWRLKNKRSEECGATETAELQDYREMTVSCRNLQRETLHFHIHTHTHSQFDANAQRHYFSTGGFLRSHTHTHAQTWNVGMFGFECELTRHSGECRPGRTVPLVPSTSQADDPATTEPIQCARLY